jgi:hypothetical protein
MNIAILGWGSLIWDANPAFDLTHGEWQPDGPELKLEFSRVSQTAPRRGVLTLVIDPQSGAATRVWFSMSKRSALEEAIEDLRARERSPSTRSIGYIVAAAGKAQYRNELAGSTIRSWATARRIDAAIWTDLPSNFESSLRNRFSISAAIAHLKSLDTETRSRAIEYIKRAPAFVDTPLRTALQAEDWFR